MLNIVNTADRMTLASMDIGKAVGQVETSAHLALRDGALMVASLLDGVMATGIHDRTVIEQAIAGLNQVADAQRSYADMHRRLAAIGRKQGLDVQTWGDVQAYGDCGPTPSASAKLQAV